MVWSFQNFKDNFLKLFAPQIVARGFLVVGGGPASWCGPTANWNASNCGFDVGTKTHAVPKVVGFQDTLDEEKSQVAHCQFLESAGEGFHRLIDL